MRTTLIQIHITAKIRSAFKASQICYLRWCRKLTLPFVKANLGLYLYFKQDVFITQYAGHLEM